MPNEVVGFKINGSTYKYDHNELENLPTIDATPTANSTNAVQSGGVKTALDGLQAEIPTVDSVPTQGSSNAVSSGGVYEALQNINTGWNATAIDLLDQIGDYIAFTSPTGGQLWDDLIDELQNSTPATMYTVTWSGSNYTASNSATSVREGRGYECTVSPNEGYIISAMTVMMGETAITPTISEGVYSISIASVTGNISISVTTQADTSDIMYHVENLVCDGTQSPIETPLQFSSASANGVTDDWTLCARAITTGDNHYKYVFVSGSDSTRLVFETYVATTGARVRAVSYSDADFQSMKNNSVAVVVTHSAGDNRTLTVSHISKATGEIVANQFTADNGVNYLDYANAQTPLCIGGKIGDSTNNFIGTIEDVTIYNRILTSAEISAYLTGGESA